MVAMRYTRNLFLRGLCIIYLFAFSSLYIQNPGLYGDSGVLPANKEVDLSLGGTLMQKLKFKPTLLWFAPYIGLNVEYMLDVLILVGVFVSFLGFVSQKFCIAPTYALLWMLYFSIFQAGQTFMADQWDPLLLEIGFLSIFIAPTVFSVTVRKTSPKDSITLWAVRWLLFRVIFTSGILKFTTGSSKWWNLDAISGFFESQCLPTPLAWYLHKLPRWVLRLFGVSTNVLELVIPFLFFFPNRKVRMSAFFILLFHQLTIATQNYNVHNLLIMCMSISLLDDQFFYEKKSKKEESKQSKLMNYISTGICGLVFGFIALQTVQLYKLRFNNDWTISSEIGFTKEQFKQFVHFFAPASIHWSVISLAMTFSYAVANAVLDSKGFQKKLLNTIGILVYTVFIGSIFAYSLVPYVGKIYPAYTSKLPSQIKQYYETYKNYRFSSSYDILSDMHGLDGRYEIVLEGSNNYDGPWKEYSFMYKPGNINSSLPFVAPYQPRIDWHVWTVSKGSHLDYPWIMSMTYRLLRGQPEVLALLDNNSNPFKAAPPTYIRANIYRYQFTSLNQKDWWSRQKVKEYFPAYSRTESPLVDYLKSKKFLPNAKKASTVKANNLQATLDFLRSLVTKIEPTVLLWGIFTSGCAIIMTA